MYKHETPQYEVQKVKLSAEERDKLMEYLCKQHSDTLDARKSYEEKWRLWSNQGNGRRKRKGAGARDSDIDVPTTREYMMQNSARVQTPILQQGDDPFVCIPTAPQHEDLAMRLEPFVNYMARRINLRVFMDAWIEQFQLFNAGYVKTSFSTEYEFVKRWVPVDPEEDIQVLKEAGVTVVERQLDDGGVAMFKEEKSKRIKRVGCFPEVVPIEDMIHPLTASDPECEWITHRMWPTGSEIKFKIKEGVWDEKTPDGEDVFDLLQKTERDRFVYPVENPEDQQTSITKQYDIRETYLRWKCGDEMSEIIVTWEPNSKTFLSIIYNFLHEYHRPFVAHQYKPVQNLMYGIPLTYIIEPLHIAYSASVNQRLDQASLANETLLFGPPNLDIGKKADATIRGGFYGTNATRDEIWSLNLGSNFTQLPDLENTIEQHMQKLAGLSDYSFGQEQVGRPTASGTMQLVEESKHPQYLQLERFRDSLALVMKHALARYKQFYPEGVRIYEQTHQEMPTQMGEPRPSALQEISVTWPEGSIEDSIIVETKVSSSTMSKNMRKQEIVALVDKMPEIYNTLGQFAMQASTPNPQAPAASLVALSLLNGYQNIISKFMREFEISDPQIVNPPLVQEAQVAQQINQQFMALQQQMQQLAAQNQQLQAQLQRATGGAKGGVAQPPQGQPGPQGPPPMGPGA